MQQIKYQKQEMFESKERIYLQSVGHKEGQKESSDGTCDTWDARQSRGAEWTCPRYP